MAEPAFKPDLRSVQPAKPEGNRPQFESVQGGRPAPTEADRAARGKRYEQTTSAEAPTQRADAEIISGEIDPVLEDLWGKEGDTAEALTEQAQETATVVSEARTTTTTTDSLPQQSFEPSTGVDNLLELESAAAATTTPDEARTVQTPRVTEAQRRQMAADHGPDDFFTFDTTQVETPARPVGEASTAIFSPTEAPARPVKASEAVTVETPATPVAEVSQLNQTIDAWLRKPEATFESADLLPDDWEKTSAGRALNRGWEGVRNRVNKFFTDSQGKERKGRLRLAGLSLGSLGMIAIIGLNAYATEGFAAKVKDHIDTMQKHSDQIVEQMEEHGIKVNRGLL